MGTGRILEISVSGFPAATLQCFAGSSRIDSCNFCVGGFVQLRCGSVCFSFRCVRQHFFITLEGTGQNDPGVCHFSEEYPDTGLGFYPFSSLGIGTGVGFIALLISTFAFMTRAFIEVIDEVSCDAMEGLTACGGTFWHKVCQGIVPTCLTQFIAWFLYCIELNIRASTIVGMVGGGGIGLVLFSYIKSFNYAGAAGIILVIAAMVIMVEFLTNYLRRKVLT